MICRRPQPGLLQSLGKTLDSVINGAKEKLGIKSPSRVFAGIGENMGLGMEKGFINELAEARRNMIKSVGTITEDLSRASTIHLVSPAAQISRNDTYDQSKNITVNQTINAENTSYAEQQRRAEEQM